MHLIGRLLLFWVALLVCAAVAQTSFFSRMGFQTLSYLFELRGIRATSQSIVIVGIDEESIHKIGPWPFPRQLHTKLLDRLKEADVVGFDLLFSADDSYIELLQTDDVPVVMAAVALDYQGHLLAPDVSKNKWIRIGHVETELGGDGIVRRVEPVKNGIASFAWVMAGRRPEQIDEPHKKRLINFYGPEFTFLYVSYSDVLNGEYPPDFFKGRKVFVGSRALGLGDVHAIPFSWHYPVPGIEIQATILNNLLDNSFLHRPVRLTWLFSILLLSLLFLIWARKNEVKNTLLNLAVLGAVGGVSLLFFHRNIFINPVVPGFTIICGYLLHLGSIWVRVTRRVFDELQELNNRLKEGVKNFSEAVPAAAIFSRQIEEERRASGLLGGVGLERWMNRLQCGIHALGLQNSFVQHLLSTEAPPLVFWNRESGRVVTANARFHTLWRELHPQQSGPPDLAAFRVLLANSRIGKKKPQEEQKQKKNTHTSVFSGEVAEDIVFCNSGRRFFIRVVYHEVDRDIAGFAGIIASFTDVTEIRELERLKGEVMNIVSHELKLPLTTILGYAEMLAERVTGNDRRYAAEVARQAKRLAKMIEDFLDIARIESGKYTVNSFPVNLLDVMNDAIAAVEEAARAAKITVVPDFPAKVSALRGDEILLVQMVINLLDNAIKFSPPESVVHIALLETKNEFQLSVADEGRGISGEAKEWIFEKFTREEGEHRASGFGLGLNFVRQVVQSHNGRISVRNGRERGAIFEIALPRRPGLGTVGEEEAGKDRG